MDRFKKLLGVCVCVCRNAKVEHYINYVYDNYQLFIFLLLGDTEKKWALVWLSFPFRWHQIDGNSSMENTAGWLSNAKVTLPDLQLTKISWFVSELNIRNPGHHIPCQGEEVRITEKQANCKGQCLYARWNVSMDALSNINHDYCPVNSPVSENM